MATTPPSSTEATLPNVQEAPKKRRFLRGLLVVLVLLAVSVSSAAGMWFWTARNASDCGSPADAPLTQVEAPSPPPAPIFMSMEPFTVSLQSETMERMMHVRVNLRLKDDRTRDRLENYLPEVRNRVLMLLSAQAPATITTPKGKTALAQAINHVLTQPFSPLTDEQSIMDVLFTEFVVQ